MDCSGASRSPIFARSTIGGWLPGTREVFCRSTFSITRTEGRTEIFALWAPTLEGAATKRVATMDNAWTRNKKRTDSSKVKPRWPGCFQDELLIDGDEIAADGADNNAAGQDVVYGHVGGVERFHVVGDGATRKIARDAPDYRSQGFRGWQIFYVASCFPGSGRAAPEACVVEIEARCGIARILNRGVGHD